MAMVCRVSVTLDAKSEAALKRIMKRTGWNKSRALREAIWANAKSQGLLLGPSPDERRVPHSTRSFIARRVG
jgi:hypothetical protein